MIKKTQKTMIKIGNADIVNIYVGDSGATAVYVGNDLVWSGGTAHDYSLDYFTAVALESGSYSWNVSNVEYSLNDGSWTAWDSANGLSVSQGDKVRFRSSTNTSYNGKTFGSTGNFNLEGNSMSLFYGDNFSGVTSNLGDSAFNSTFKNNIKLINAENLIFPALRIGQRTFYYTFYGCTSLVKAPKELPATTINNWSYHSMFAECSALTQASKFLVTGTTTQQAFNSTFANCKSLVVPPELELHTLGQGELVFCFMGCSSLATPIKLPATTLTSACYQQLFAECTSLTTAPELPAATLTSQAYDGIFSGCTSLNYIKCLATNISATNCTRNWVNGVAATGTFAKDPSMSSWTTGVNGIPSGWSVEDAS